MRANGSRECAPDDRLREAIHCRTTKMDCFVASAPRNDINNLRRAAAISRLDSARVMRELFRPINGRAREMPGARCTRSPVCKVVSTRVSRHRSTGNTRHFLRNGFNGFLRALLGDRALLPPSPARCASIVANLTPASGRQDHTASPSAKTLFVRATNCAQRPRVHRIPSQRS